MKRYSTGWPTTQVIRKEYGKNRSGLFIVTQRKRLLARKVRLTDLTTSSEMAKHVKDEKVLNQEGSHCRLNFHQHLP